MAQSACHHGHVSERKDPDREVLTSLPHSRPVRRSAKRGDRPAATAAAKPATAAGQPAKPRTPRAPRAAGAGAGTSAPSSPPDTPSPDDGSRASARAAPTRKIPAAGYAAPSSRADDPATASAGADLVSTVIQAGAELAQIGLAIGRQSLRSMLERLPKP